MLPDWVSNPGPLTYESGALPTALRGPATSTSYTYICWVLSHPQLAKAIPLFDWFLSHLQLAGARYVLGFVSPTTSKAIPIFVGFCFTCN